MAAEVKTKFEGKWTLSKSDNLEAFLEKTGVGSIKTKVALKLTPTMVISVDIASETISITISAGPKTNKTSFKLGEEYTIEGEFTGKAVTTLIGGKLHTTGTPSDAKLKTQTITVVRDIVDGELVQTMTVEDVTARRIFKKV